MRVNLLFEALLSLLRVTTGCGALVAVKMGLLDQIIQRYTSTIAALFWGHTHREWETSNTNYTHPSFSSATAIHYIAPALTPTSANPTFRVYSIDPETYAILDYTV